MFMFIFAYVGVCACYRVPYHTKTSKLHYTNYSSKHQETTGQHTSGIYQGYPNTRYKNISNKDSHDGIYRVRTCHTLLRLSYRVLKLTSLHAEGLKVNNTQIQRIITSTNRHGMLQVQLLHTTPFLHVILMFFQYFNIILITVLYVESRR
jgi:hypothetical protein